MRKPAVIAVVSTLLGACVGCHVGRTDAQLELDVGSSPDGKRWLVLKPARALPACRENELYLEKAWRSAVHEQCGGDFVGTPEVMSIQVIAAEIHTGCRTRAGCGHGLSDVSGTFECR